uniref:Uncharacterized protein n=1 Tax=Rhizophora mucronata TaxID=61149 RepID=A0A2P2QDL0_RHIMU
MPGELSVNTASRCQHQNIY